MRVNFAVNLGRVALAVMVVTVQVSLGATVWELHQIRTQEREVLCHADGKMQHCLEINYYGQPKMVPHK